jgi:hypothetical protein
MQQIADKVEMNGYGFLRGQRQVCKTAGVSKLFFFNTGVATLMATVIEGCQEQD